MGNVIIAHGGGGDSAVALLFFLPAGVMLLIGLILVFTPLTKSEFERPPGPGDADEQDLAHRLLGEEEARQLRARGRRRRAMRRRALQRAVPTPPGERDG